VTFCNISFASAVKARDPLPANARLQEVVRDPVLLDLLKEVLATGQPIRKRLMLGPAAGRVFEVQAAPIAGPAADGRNAGAIAILHEVTALEHLERVRKDFVANISHDLRTPLAAIQGYAETLLEGASENRENNRKFLEIIRANAVRLGDLAADLLMLSELESERIPPPPERLSVRDAAETAVRMVEHDAADRNVIVTIGEGEPLYVLGHKLRFERALLNLLQNGVRFNGPGGHVRVETEQLAGEVSITVRDTGIGIASSELPRIFERSYCVDKARSKEGGGTGLGLAIVKHVAEKMGGTVSVRSQLGKGSAFTLHFPAADLTVH